MVNLLGHCIPCFSGPEFHGTELRLCSVTVSVSMFSIPLCSFYFPGSLFDLELGFDFMYLLRDAKTSSVHVGL